MRMRILTGLAGAGRADSWGGLAFFSASRKWLSFQAYTVCVQSRERACGSEPDQVSAPPGEADGGREGGREEGLKQVT